MTYYEHCVTGLSATGRDEHVDASEHPHTALSDAALRYAQDRQWDIALGTWLIWNGRGVSCSCGQPDCAAPGVHPAERNWQEQATSNPARVRHWWSRHPQASIVAPTGRSFDVIDVPEQAGFLALARLERNGALLGPVMATAPRRLLFFVLPGSGEKFPDLLRQTGWGGFPLDLIYRGAGDYILAPPSRLPSGVVQWVRPPTEANQLLSDVSDLINPIAYACGRHILPSPRRAVG